MKEAPAMTMLAPEHKDGGRANQHLAFALQVKAARDDGTIEGYGSVFDVVDAYSDAIAKGAFKESLRAHKAEGTMPAMLWQHDPTEPIGVWTDMVEDDRGLRVVGKLALETVRGREAHALLKMGALNGLSIGFRSKKWTYDTDSDTRTLTEVELWEVSLVTFPANDKARITDVRSADEIAAPKDAERILRDAGFSRADAMTFVSRVMRLGEERSESAQSTALAIMAAKLLTLNLTLSKD